MDRPIMLFPIDMAELQQFIKMTVQGAVRITAVPSASPSYPEILTKKEAIKFLGQMSVPTFDKLVKEGKINKYKPSDGRIVFLKSELMTYVMNTKVGMPSAF